MYINHVLLKILINKQGSILNSKSSIGRTLSDDINIETDNFDNGVYWITPSTLGNPSDNYGRLVKMDNYKMFVSATATSGIYYARELWVSIYVNSTWTSFNCFSDDATVLLAAQNTTPPYKIFSSSSNDQEVDEYLEDYSQPYAHHTHYYIAMNLTFVHSTLGGGDMLIEGYKANENYEWQKATKYDSSGIVSFARSKMNQIWTDWNSKNIS